MFISSRMSALEVRPATQDATVCPSNSWALGWFHGALTSRCFIARSRSQFSFSRRSRFGVPSTLSKSSPGDRSEATAEGQRALAFQPSGVADHSQLAGQRVESALGRSQPHAAEVDGVPGDLARADASAGAVAGLQNSDTSPGLRDPLGSAQSGEPCAHDHHIRRHVDLPNPPWEVSMSTGTMPRLTSADD